MNKIFITLIILALGLQLRAQEVEQVDPQTEVVAEVQEEEQVEEDSPVRSPFNAPTLIDGQTVVTPVKGSFQMVLHHRFGLIKQMSDLYGIYGPSNIRLGVNYGVTDNLMLGFGTEKNNKLQELQVKWNILRQMKSDKIPVALTYFFATNLDTRPEEVFGENYRFSNRFSFFHQLILARKFNSRVSIEAAASYAHFNSVDSIWQNDRAGVMIGGKIGLVGNLSLIGEYDYPIHLKTVRYYQARVKPNLSAGIEINTSTHVFQIFVANYSHIMAAKNYAFNTNDFTKGEFLLGFNITIRL
jgi:hypothetical protein